jgi:hypothetical protein
MDVGLGLGDLVLKKTTQGIVEKKRSMGRTKKFVFLLFM